MQLITITDLIKRPSAEFIKTEIYGIGFFKRLVDPNVYVIESDDIITDKNISFIYNNILYVLQDIIIHRDEPKIIECRYWKEEVIY